MQVGSIWVATLLVLCSLAQAKSPKPNVLIAITDDHSYPHLSVMGSNFVNTPTVDQLAKQGVLFTNAYAASPGCAPSRAALLAGQHQWMIGAAGTHASGFSAQVTTFVDLLENAGYKAGFTGKGWGPGSWKMGGRTKNPAGTEFNRFSLDNTRPKGIAAFDYARNFDDFMNQRANDQSFVFWFGSKEPHLKYAEGPRSAQQLATAEVPKFMPDTDASRSMLLDYADEIKHFDNHLKQIIERLKQAGELDNTLIIITADNGMPMPRAKANGYDYGVHVPLVIYWGDRIKKAKVIDSPVGFVDLSATILDVAGLPMPAQFTGESLKSVLTGHHKLNYERAVFAGRERHSSARHNNLGYPQRIMRSGDYLTIYNPKPERHPAGDPVQILNGKFADGFYDIDDSVSKRELLLKRKDPSIAPYFHLAVDKRPKWEFFNVKDDPYNLTNLADSAQHQALFKQHQTKLIETLKSTGDLRLMGLGDLWEEYPRVQGPMRYFQPPTKGSQ